MQGVDVRPVGGGHDRGMELKDEPFWPCFPERSTPKETPEIETDSEPTPKS